MDPLMLIVLGAACLVIFGMLLSAMWGLQKELTKARMRQEEMLIIAQGIACQLIEHQTLKVGQLKLDYGLDLLPKHPTSLSIQLESVSRHLKGE
jgi:xanthine/uracil permease